jgi:hypothetical protein
VKDTVEKTISQYQPSSPENPRHTIRFMKDPTHDWDKGHGPAEDNDEVGRSWNKQGYLVLQINGAATEVLQRRKIGYKLGQLKQKITFT